MSPTIKIENLGKCYQIDRQATGRTQSYVALRDVVVEKASYFLKNAHRPHKLFNASTYKEDFWSLKNINLDIAQGEKIAVIGKNGAGKSTLLKILSQITEPTTGKVSIHGRVASLLEVGTGFHPELTGRENIFLNGAILGMSSGEVRKKFDEIVDFAGVEKFLDTPVKRYSSGMRMRLGFAVAAHLESEILVVDEVLAVGDGEFQKKCLGKMDSVSRSEGKTILFVSHNMSAVQQLCSKGIILNKGEVFFQGNITESLSTYQNLISSQDEGFNLIRKHPSVELVQSKLVGDIQSSSDWNFSFTFKSEEDMHGCFFDFGVYNDKYYPILHHFSPPAALFFDIKKGLFEIKVRIAKVQLNTGPQSLIIYLSRNDGTVLYEAKEIPVAFVAAPYSYTGPSAIISNEIRVEMSPL